VDGKEPILYKMYITQYLNDNLIISATRASDEFDVHIIFKNVQNNRMPSHRDFRSGSIPA